MNKQQIAWRVATFLGLKPRISIENCPNTIFDVFVIGQPRTPFNPYDSDIVLRCMEKGKIDVTHDRENDTVSADNYSNERGWITEEGKTISAAVIQCVLAISDCEIPKELEDK